MKEYIDLEELRDQYGWSGHLNEMPFWMVEDLAEQGIFIRKKDLPQTDTGITELRLWVVDGRAYLTKQDAEAALTLKRRAENG